MSTLGLTSCDDNGFWMAAAAKTEGYGETLTQFYVQVSSVFLSVPAFYLNIRRQPQLVFLSFFFSRRTGIDDGGHGYPNLQFRAYVDSKVIRQGNLSVFSASRLLGAYGIDAHAYRMP